MNPMKSILACCFLLAAFAINAQDATTKIKITDLEGVSTVLTRASSSSSNSCNSPDFPVLKGGSRKNVDLNEINWISVLHGEPVSNDQIYIGVELTLKDGTTDQCEMIKNIRFMGQSDQGDFSIEVKDVSTVQVLHDQW
jgi:hypothetical protein